MRPYEDQLGDRGIGVAPCVSNGDFEDGDECVLCGKHDTVFNCKFVGLGTRWCLSYLRERERLRTCR